MKVSYNWLKQYLNFDLTPVQVAEILTDTGLEVEGVEQYESIKGGLKGIVIGEVKTCKPHPNADKLSVTSVDIGTEEELPIVCGAPNVAAGQKVVVATVGTTLYKGEEEFPIKKAKIRGEVSRGMICAEDEIGLGTSHDGIMVLPDDAQPGTPASQYFDIEYDTVFEIGLTPNRIDGASHIGAARDLAAFLQSRGDKEAVLILPDVGDFAVDNTNNPIPVEVKNREACPRYSGITISDVEVKESPDWLKHRLEAIGQKPINNVVDVTNFILHEMGQPLHSFDADRITGKKVIVKTLTEGTKFKTLDEEEQTLTAEDLMICNTKEGMCIAGVFGGIDSGVTEETKNIFLESAYFNPTWVRKTSKRHALQTDSSFRFERGTNPNLTVFAMKRAAVMIKQLTGGNISSEIVDVYPEKIKDFNIEVSYKNIDRLIGKTIARDQIKQILTSLDIDIAQESDDGIVVNVPPYRVDVTREADIIEEILRIYGYNKVEIHTQVQSTLSYSAKPDPHALENMVSEYLSNNGFNEAMSNSLTKSGYYESLNTYKPEHLVHIFNPLSADLNVMRQTLLFGGLESVAYNLNRKNENIKLYEYGNCYFRGLLPEDKCLVKNYYEERHLGIFICGNKHEINWVSPEKPTSFFLLKSYTENVLKKLHFDIDELKEEELHNDIFRYGLKYTYNKQVVAEFGAVNQDLLNSFDIETDVFYADLNWTNIIAGKPETKGYKPIPKFPEVRRDLALLLDKNISFKELKQIAHQTEKKLLKKVSIFDVYEGKNIEKGKKSYALSFILQDEKKTLKDKQIDKIMNKLMNTYKQKVDAEIR